MHKIYKDLLSKIFDPDLTCTYSLNRTCLGHSLYIFNLTSLYIVIFVFWADT